MKNITKIIQIFIGQLQVEAYCKGSHNCCNLQNDILLGLKWVEKNYFVAKYIARKIGMLQSYFSTIVFQVMTI
jgi:hypothetical protein